MRLHNATSIGKRAEDIAEKFLRSCGMKIRARNFRYGRVGEIDIIADDGDVLVFIEVKARSSSLYGSPESAVTATKQRVLRHVAAGYLHICEIEHRECRFDVVAIRWNGGVPHITHIKHAFA
ncbi:MAG: YraN family protein [Bacteroidota bacterium]|nr:YraN family protein [Candidatus Kapabacteria bacterium]MDW8221136.1 YraN family protein [Bacteroidota bacterium]